MELGYLWIFFSYFGDIAYWLGFTISFFLIFPFLEERDREKTRWIYLLLIPTILCSYGISLIIKQIFQISRPCIGLANCPSTYSFPSGHATIAFTFVTIILLKFRKKIFIPLIFLAMLVGISRIALGFHRPIDVIAGSLLGILFSFIGFYSYKKVFIEGVSKFILRKVFHSFGILIILLNEVFGTKITFYFLVSSSIIYLVSEILRINQIYFPFFHDMTEKCIYKNKLRRMVLNPFYYLLALSILILFPQKVFYISSISLVVGDSFASLIGKEFGKHKFFYNPKKSLEGFLAFFLSTFLIYIFMIDPFRAFLLAILGAFFESVYKKMENFLLPVSVGIISYLLA